MARTVIRAFAAYFSDLLLWVSVAGAFEIIAVVGMALLCILSAGYFFDHMKKNPFVLVLGGVVALGGTFLMFREVRGLILPPPAVVVPQPSPPVSPPSHESTSQSSNEGDKPLDVSCRGLLEVSCSTNPKCFWWDSINICMTLPKSTPTSEWNFPSPSYQLTTCTLLPESNCKETKACYWSPLFNRCERLIVGTGLGAGQPTRANCNGLGENTCKSRSDCLWILNGCMTDYLKNPLAQ